MDIPNVRTLSRLHRRRDGEDTAHMRGRLPAMIVHSGHEREQQRRQAVKRPQIGYREMRLTVE
eukprot:COSAG05_NODE_2265_length_3314_cov_55.001758_2_plen_63_part_00